jgi:hypothetical protein
MRSSWERASVSYCSPRSSPRSCPLVDWGDQTSPRRFRRWSPPPEDSGRGPANSATVDNPLNDPAGRLTLEGAPETYTPGQEYALTVTLARPGLTRAGFQLTAREDGFAMLSGTDAGSLEPLDMTAEVMRAGPGQVTYAQHSESGSELPPGSVAKWQVLWTAPPEPNVPRRVPRCRQRVE